MALYMTYECMAFYDKNEKNIVIMMKIYKLFMNAVLASKQKLEYS